MDKEKPSFADMETLLTELAEQDRREAACEAARLEHMRAAMRGGIRRHFRRRRCLRLAGSLALLALLAIPLTLLPEISDAGATSLANTKAALPSAKTSPTAQSPEPPEGFCADARIRYAHNNRVQYGASCHGGYDIEVCPVPL